MTHFSFENLEVYQKAIAFGNNIYTLTKLWPREYLFDLTSQIRRAALLIPLNIAEGTSRGKKDFSRFIDIARGSCFECAALLEIVSTQNLINQTTKDELTNELVLLSKMLSGLKKSMNH